MSAANRRQAHVWDLAGSIPISRACPMKGQSGPLKPGVKYFVLQLDRLGATTAFSCEGHPDGFYVTYYATERVARKIASCGGFLTEINAHPGWRLSLRRDVSADKHRVEALRSAAAAWERMLGPLDIAAVRAWPHDQPFNLASASAEPRRRPGKRSPATHDCAAGPGSGLAHTMPSLTRRGQGVTLPSDPIRRG